jgi:hypothetical protein
MKKYALINNAVVTQTIDIEEEDFLSYAKDNHMVIDISDMSPVPQIGWVLNGNQLQFPTGVSDREKMEIQLNKNKREFGTLLSNTSIDRIGARNKILMKTGPQVTELLTHLMGVKALLETGALGTARYSCTQLKYVYTEYADIFDYVIGEINLFESSFGL